MTSIGRVTPLILPDLGNQRVQLPLLKRFLRFYRSLVHRARLFVVLLSPNLGNTSMLALVCVALLLERNSRNSLSPLLMMFLSSARIVRGPVLLPTPLAGAYQAIYWTCMLGGDVLPRRTDTLNIRLKTV